jgi:hypothetical protein
MRGALRVALWLNRAPATIGPRRRPIGTPRLDLLLPA